MIRVIIADDEKKICQLLKVLVDWEALGFEILAMVHDGESLLALVESLRPEVVITDIQMPGMSGLELLHAIREKEWDIDVIIISGYREFDYVRESLKDGASDYLLKPLSKEALNEALQKVKERRKESRESREYVETIERQLKGYSEELKHNIIRDLTEGKCKSISERELEERYGFVRRNGAVFIATIKYDMQELLPQKTMETVSKKLRQIIEKEAKKSGNTTVIDGNKNRCYLIIDSASLEAAEDYLFHVISESKDYLSNWHDSHVSIGLVRVEDDDWAAALERSEDIVYDQLFRGCDRVLFYKEKQPGGTGFTPDAEDTEELRVALTSLSEDRLKRVVEKMLNDAWVKGEEIQSGQTVVNGVRSVYRTIADACEQIYPEALDKEKWKDWEILIELCGTLRSIRQLFELETDRLFETLTEYKQQRGKQPVRQIKSIIEEHYNEDLSLDDIAQTCGMSPAYISKLFKKELGINLMQYINNVRLEHAKKMLAESNDTITQIAEAVGFRDEKYFLRVFKKEVGLTTSEYRHLHGE